MCYSIEPRERRYVKGYGFLSFSKDMGTHAARVAKKLNNKDGQNLVDTTKKSAADALKIAVKEQFKKQLKHVWIM